MLEKIKIPSRCLFLSLISPMLYTALGTENTLPLRVVILGGAVSTAILCVGWFGLSIWRCNVNLDKINFLKMPLIIVLVSVCVVSGLKSFAQMEELYFRQFETGHFWILLAIVLLCFMHCSGQSLSRAGGVLLVLGTVIAIISVVGLIPQISLHSLSVEDISNEDFLNVFFANLYFYPEFLLCLFFGEQKTIKENTSQKIFEELKISQDNKKSRICKNSKVQFLPLAGFGIVVFVASLSELVFGMRKTPLKGVQVLEAWELAAFSRFDVVILLFWILITFYRLRLFMFVVVELLGKGKRGCVNEK